MSEEKSLTAYSPGNKARVIVISGGKGGVGKTFFAVNFAIELKSRGYKVLVFDADINLANVNIMLHIDESKNFQDFISRRLSILKLIQKGVGGVDAIYVGDELNSLFEIGERQYNAIVRGLTKIETAYDYIIIDTGAGLNKLHMRFMQLADRTIMLTNPELTALVDLYKVIKIMSNQTPGLSFDVVINKASGAESAAKIYTNISQTAARFQVNVDLSFLGYILDEPKRVLESIQKRTPLLILHETGNIHECFRMITSAFLKGEKQRRRFHFFYSLLHKR